MSTQELELREAFVKSLARLATAAAETHLSQNQLNTLQEELARNPSWELHHRQEEQHYAFLDVFAAYRGAHRRYK